MPERTMSKGWTAHVFGWNKCWTMHAHCAPRRIYSVRQKDDCEWFALNVSYSRLEPNWDRKSQSDIHRCSEIVIFDVESLIRFHMVNAKCATAENVYWKCTQFTGFELDKYDGRLNSARFGRVMRICELDIVVIRCNVIGDGKWKGWRTKCVTRTAALFIFVRTILISSVPICQLLCFLFDTLVRIALPIFIFLFILCSVALPLIHL